VFKAQVLLHFKHRVHALGGNEPLPLLVEQGTASTAGRRSPHPAVRSPRRANRSRTLCRLGTCAANGPLERPNQSCSTASPLPTGCFPAARLPRRLPSRCAWRPSISPFKCSVHAPYQMICSHVVATAEAAAWSEISFFSAVVSRPKPGCSYSPGHQLPTSRVTCRSSRGP
jgi:hypothetical protein